MLGWTEFVCRQQGRGDFDSLSEVKHLARRLSRQYTHRGVLVVRMTGNGRRENARRR